MAHLQKYLDDNNVAGGPHGNHHIYWIPMKVFKALPISRWKHNRPPDKERISEIHQYMTTSKRVDGIIYLACVDQRELVCYESNHRREALVGITDVEDILVDILWDATDEMVKAEFLRLNKAVSVPELYVSDDSPVDFNEVLRIRNEFCEKYKALKSTSKNCHAPSFNSDSVLDEFARVMKENKISATELWNRLMHLNSAMAMRDRKKLTPKVIEKCEKTGLWLFAWGRTLSEKELAYPVPL